MSMKQKEISQFYEKILPESQTCKENRNSTTPSRSAQRFTEEKSDHAKFLRQKGIKK